MFKKSVLPKIFLGIFCALLILAGTGCGRSGDNGALFQKGSFELVPAKGSTTVIEKADNGKKFIYGLKTDLKTDEFEKDFIVIPFGYHLVYEYYNGNDGVIGTHTRVLVVDSFSDEVVDTYCIVIFGDVNGDGNIDSGDAGIITDVENWVIEWDAVTDACLFKAGDVNGDGNIGQVDADIIVNVENYMQEINQVTGLAQ